MIKLSVTLCWILILILAISCQTDNRPYKSELTIGTENDLVNLDPIKTVDVYTIQVVGQVFEGLVALNHENNLEPLLAERWWHSDDFKRWRFDIRKAVFFHDDDCFGTQRTREVTAEDVRYSLQRIASKESSSSFVLVDVVKGVKEFQEGKSKDVSGFQVVEPQTLEIQLLRSEPNFLYRLTSPWFSVFPKEAVALGPNVFGRTKVIGTGPFRLLQRTDTEVVLERNSNYWHNVEGNTERLKFRVVKNEQIRMSELKNGKIAIMQLPVVLMPSVLSATPKDEYVLNPRFSQNFSIKTFKAFNVIAIGFNCSKLDIHLRRAISFAIDRREIVRVVANNSGILLVGPVPPGLLGYMSAYPDDIYNLSRARDELMQAQFDTGSESVELLIHEKGNSEQLGQLVQEQLKRIGLQVNLKKLSFNAVINRMIRGETQAFFVNIEYAFSSPELILNNFFNSSSIPAPNFWRYKNVQLDASLNRLSMIGNRTESNSYSQEIEKQIVDDSPAAFLYQSKNPVIFRNNISNLFFNGHNIPLLWKVQINN